MKMKTKPIAGLVMIALISSLHAGDDGKKKKEEKEKERQERREKRESIDAVLAAKDANRDGSLTLEEYLTGEADAEAATKRFEQYNKNGDRYLTRKELEASLGL